MRKNKDFGIKRLIMITFLLIFAFSLCACGDKNGDENGHSDVSVDAESSDLKEYIEERYGFADNPIYAKRITHTETITGSAIMSYEERINEDSKVGTVFYKSVSLDERMDGLLCVHVGTWDDRIELEITYMNDYDSLSSGSATRSLLCPNTNTQYYVIVENNHFAIVELSEEKDVAADNLVYQENITVYKLTSSSCDEIYTIRRKVESNVNESKSFQIQNNTEWIVYASGYENFIAEGAVFVSTQKEFCDRANELLKSSLLDCISLNKISWNNRWFGTSIDESAIGDNIVKVDFLFSESLVDENGDEVTDIIIKINDEKQQLADGEKLEKIEDFPVAYGQNSETTSEKPVVMPENIPQSFRTEDLQELTNFNLDGYWYSSDYRYVYRIYTQNPDNGFGTLYFVDTTNNDGAKHGQVKQTSSYSVILKAMEDNGFSPEVCAANNQLVSDELTLTRVNDSIVNNIIGSWKNGDTTYTFDNDGKYTVLTNNDSYWGYYFPIDESRIVLGVYSDNLKKINYSFKCFDYSIDMQSFVIKGLISLNR